MESKRIIHIHNKPVIGTERGRSRSNMSALMSWWRKVRGKPTEQQKAEAAVQQAQDEVTQVRDRITGEIAHLKQLQLVLRAELQQQVKMGAPRSALADTTKKLKQTERQIREKENLHANVARETTQLQDTTTNTRVASALLQSVEAQKQLQKLDLGGRELDDALDEIEENRDDTRELSDRLAHLGGDDLDEMWDEDNMHADDIVAAMGLRTERKDDILLEEVAAQLSEGWRKSGPRALSTPTAPLDVHSGAAAEVDAQYTPEPEAFSMPAVPGNITMGTTQFQFTD